MKKLLLFVFLLSSSLHAESKYPVDITYMVADLKYSEESGVKICELQHGILSTFLGDVFLNGGNGLLCPKIQSVFAEFPIKKWAVTTQLSFRPLINTIEQASDWKKKITHELLVSDPVFSEAAHAIPKNPYSIASYKGMVYAKPNTFKKYDEYHKANPGMVIIDAASHPYWIDKYKMTRLFSGNLLLEQIKPEWGLYPKEYTDSLAEQIINEIQGDIFVIKPRGAFLGNGVIIVAKEDLDETLDYILNKSEALAQNTDASYSYWQKDTFDTFLVEKYYPSDVVQVEAHGGKLFEPTMRVAFILIYNNKTIDFRFLGGYWLLPYKSIDETGTLNEQKKAYCKAPFFAKVSDETLEEVERQLTATLPILYQKMLEGAE